MHELSEAKNCRTIRNFGWADRGLSGRSVFGWSVAQDS